MSDRCPYHDKVVRDQARIEGEAAMFHETVLARLDKIEKILTGNGKDGLMTRVGKISTLLGVAGGVATVVMAAIIRSFF